MMILTHCDDFKDAVLDKFEEDIKNHPLSKPIYEYCKLGICRFGAIDFNKMDVYEDEEVQQPLLNRNLKELKTFGKIFYLVGLNAQKTKSP